MDSLLFLRVRTISKLTWPMIPVLWFIKHFSPLFQLSRGHIGFWPHFLTAVALNKVILACLTFSGTHFVLACSFIHSIPQKYTFLMHNSNILEFNTKLKHAGLKGMLRFPNVIFIFSWTLFFSSGNSTKSN